MNTNNHLEADEIAEEIADYLKAHPDSADTLEGVVEWWLIRQRYLRGLNQVHTALELLVQRGVVKRERGFNGEFIYFYGNKKF